VLLKVAHAFLYTLDFFQSHQLCPSRCYLTFFHIERSIALVKRLAGSPKDEIDPNLPANKVLLKVARILIYMDGLLSVKLCPNRCYLTFFHIPERSIALVKRLAGSQRAEIDPNLPHNVLLQGAHAFLYTLMDFFQSHQTVPKPLLSYLLPFPERSIALVKRLAGSQRADINLPNKVLLKVAHAFLYTLMDFFQSPNCKPLLSYLLPYSRTFRTGKTTGWFTKG
jgi:hypothetical protein